MDARELAAAWVAPADAERNVVAVVDSVVALLDAARSGLPASRIFVVYLEGGDDGERLAASVVASPADLAALRELSERGFELLLQALPRVTARRWAPRG
jgi:mannose/fructose/N-acetylgalactosamine-specific phosphotransferase system component IIB